jgi:hypothetical protein
MGQDTFGGTCQIKPSSLNRRLRVSTFIDRFMHRIAFSSHRFSSGEAKEFS